MYHLFKLGGNCEENCTADEFVKRVFRDLTTSVHLANGGDTITREVFGLFWNEITELVDFCKGNGLEMMLNESKQRGMFWMEIRDLQ
jgi:hypothetical protein